ncbi:unnamed protein product [Rhizophagus irregularis]|uniref:Uncharacterized protein n=1 Tax=Rhizophagus irregularis TaxID=588596 RepID=A0A2N1N6I6_9GLOM|nr:hypothetical protein RhiirC2_866688 [Rhizophagus irregularis]CAB4391610.1 unnamed protein product [Rhizophagus irregularis]CAB5380970.1 unnamed protein product [Rhizophagus irregularis]
MTTSLTVIALIVRLKVSDKTVYGDAIYREKSSQNHTFSVKQFTNARHEYNEEFHEGDLVLLGGKFTLEGTKLMLAVEMATIMEPRVDSNHKKLTWDPTSIPPSKPFVNISTTPSGPLTPLEDINFIKTQSPVYSPFHKTIRTINFDIGYSKEAKWFEMLNDKWSDYSSFYVAGFLEGIYVTDESNTDNSTEAVYAQINARIIDYDSRFRQSKSLTSNTSSFTSPKSTSAFAKRRLTASTKTKSKIITSHSPITPLTSTPTIELNDNQSSDNDSIHSIHSIHSDPPSPNSSPIRLITPISETRQTKKRRQLSDLCNTDEDPIDNNDPITPTKPKRVYNRKVTKEDPINKNQTTPKSTTTRGRKKSGC